MEKYVSDIAFTPSVKAIQERMGSRSGYEKMAQKGGWSDTVTPELAGFIAERDSFYLATAIIRHFGLLAARNVHTRLAHARTLLAPQPTTPRRDQKETLEPPTPWWIRLLQLTGIDVMLCPYCGDGRLIRTPVPLLARSPP